MKIFAAMVASRNPKAEIEVALARELALSASSESDERAGDHGALSYKRPSWSSARAGRPRGRRGAMAPIVAVNFTNGSLVLLFADRR